MRYKIGDMSKLLGVTPSTLRYYEKMGMITPEKDENTNYRYYSMENIVWLLVVKFWQASGLTIEDSVKVACKMDMDNVLKVLDSHRKVLKQKQIRAEKLCQKFGHISDQWHSRRTMAGKCSIANLPPIRFLPFLEDSNSPFSPEMTNIARQWVSYIPFASLLLILEDPLLGNTCKNCRWGLYFVENDAEELEIESHPLVQHRERSVCIHSEIVIDVKDKIDMTKLQPLKDYAKFHNFELAGGAFGIISGLVQQGGESLRVMDIYLPICE